MPRPRKYLLRDPAALAAAVREHRPDYVESFSPCVGEDCRILILGSMPGARSLAAGQYYAHPQNLFWPVMHAVFGVDATAPFARRLSQLQSCGVGLWDVLQGCERRGSLDSAITAESEVPNAIVALLARRPAIVTIALNGAKAAQAFSRHIAKKIPAERLHGLVVHTLPSTSPAHASMSRDEKIRRWSVLGNVSRPSGDLGV
ncbi:DNA-deoxyinosine glycosylase [Tahibacter sp.]|uniref:DNA-deoxyinosine glycosylase n=1 Tax=Tahibacter sp. TaxID=2056211 RepID=UPI0028C4B726|nr:DNA-deoxyinosine glycosylase [Tahibacter sp.]